MSIVIEFPARPELPEERRPGCADRDADWWFVEELYARGQQICRKCPVRRSCLDQALASGEQLGVWGGLTPAQRDALPDAVVVPLRPRAWPSGARRR